MMEYRFLGKSGLKLSALSLGAWITFGGQIGEEVAGDCMKVAYDANLNISSVITGASRPEQVRENLEALAIPDRLTPEVMERIESILSNKPEPEEDHR